MSYVASSELWGDEATARLCQIIVDANDGMAQQIVENRTDLLDLLPLKDLERTDEMDLSLPYLAVHYDRPEMLKYLHRRGVDLSKPCDPMGFGSPMFYAVNLRKLRVIIMLNSLGYSVSLPCDTFMGQTPEYHAARIGDSELQQTIESIQKKERAAVRVVQKNLLKHRYRKEFLALKRAAILIQKIFRGSQDRYMMKLVKSGQLVLEESTVVSGSEVSGTQSRRTGGSQSGGVGGFDNSEVLDAGSSYLSEGADGDAD